MCTSVHGVHTVCSWQKWHTFLVIFKSVHTFFEGPKKVCTYIFRAFEKCALMFWGLFISVHKILWSITMLCTHFAAECSRFFIAATFCIKCAQVFAAKRP